MRKLSESKTDRLKMSRAVLGRATGYRNTPRNMKVAGRGGIKLPHQINPPGLKLQINFGFVEQFIEGAQVGGNSCRLGRSLYA
jgi:hypothetical protein